MNERDIFLAAREIADPIKRASYVAQACGSDTRLRAQVQDLLKNLDQSSQFLETPAVAADSSAAHTLLTGSDDHNAEFQKYLQPASRAGWLGRLGHYEIEKVLGRGAFGIVVKAFDERLHRVVAIKLMCPEIATTSPPRKRFLREARTAAAVTQENIVAIHAVEEEPIPYLVMEYIPGKTLQQRMDERGPLELHEILRIGQQVAAGLAAAHAVNLIHRDIKPSNILLVTDPIERAKISDFGLARAVDDATLTSSGLIAGTPMYMAPEQARGEPLDHRSDLFSLGSVMYQMAGGRPPFRAANTVAVLKRVCEDTPRPLTDIVPGIPEWLESIIFRLLEKQRNNRYQSAKQVADLLAQCQEEVRLSGKVTCVERRYIVAETQLLSPTTATGSRSRSPRVKLLLGGALAATLLLALSVLNRNSNNNSNLEHATIAGGEGAADASAMDPSNLIEAENLGVRRNDEPSMEIAPPPEPLGTWEMGSEPPWFEPGVSKLKIQSSAVLPGLIERPAKLNGLKRWNVETTWPRGRVIVARYSPDSRFLAVGAHDGHVRIYSSESMELISLLPGKSGEHGVMDLSWNPDGERLAVAADGDGNSHALRIWNRNGKLLFEECTTTYGAVAWSHSGNWLAEGSIDRLSIRRDDGTVEKGLVQGSSSGVYRGGSIAWSPDDMSFAARHYSGAIRIWNVESSESVVLAENSKPADPWGFGLNWSSAGWLAVVEPKLLKLFHPATNTSREIQFDSAWDMAWYPNGLQGILIDGYSHIYQWSVDDKLTPRQVNIDWKANRKIAISPDGLRVALANEEIQAFDGDLKRQLYQSPCLTTVNDVAWSRDGQRLVACTNLNENLLQWSAEGHRTAETHPPITGDRLVAGPDSQFLLYGGSKRGLFLVAPAQLPRQLLTEPCASVDWSSDGRYIAVGTKGGGVIILNAQGDILADMSAGQGFTSVAWSPDSYRLAVHCGKQIFVVDSNGGWKLINGAQTETFAEGNQLLIWAPDSQRFSCRYVGWFDQLGRRIAELGAPYPLVWRPDGQRFLSAWITSHLPSGRQTSSRLLNGFAYAHQNTPRFHPRGHLLAVEYWQGAIACCRETDLQPYWHIALLPNNQSATFSAAGELLNGDAEVVEKSLVYVVDRADDDRLEIVKPSQFPFRNN